MNVIVRQSEKGFTLMEMVVGMGLFTVVAGGALLFLTQHLQRLGTDVKLTMASQELRNAVNLMSTELRMGSAVSPYLPGNDPTVVTCSAQVSVTSTTVKFLVSHDDSANASGIKTYYVGYKYDPAKKELLRGAIPGTSTTSCAAPAGDPTAAGVAMTVAKNVVPVDMNGDGVNEPVFSFANSTLSLNLGTEVDPLKGASVIQKVSTQVFVRTS